jgi:hypothetical protein
MLSRIVAAQECDATKADSSNAADKTPVKFPTVHTSLLPKGGNKIFFSTKITSIKKQ